MIDKAKGAEARIHQFDPNFSFSISKPNQSPSTSSQLLIPSTSDQTSNEAAISNEETSGTGENAAGIEGMESDSEMTATPATCDLTAIPSTKAVSITPRRTKGKAAPRFWRYEEDAGETVKSSDAVVSGKRQRTYQVGDYALPTHQGEEAEGVDEVEAEDAEWEKGAGRTKSQSKIKNKIWGDVYYDSSGRLNFVPVRKLHVRASQLSSSRLLILPSLANGFTAKTPQAYRLHHLAAALQWGFDSVVPSNRGDSEVHARFMLQCSHTSLAISRRSQPVKCVYSLTVERLSIGNVFLWTATQEIAHSCNSLRVVPLLEIRPRGRGRPFKMRVEARSEMQKEGSTDHQPNLVEDRQPSSSSLSHLHGLSIAIPASASAQSTGQLEATSLPVSAPVHHPFLPELTALLQRVAPNLAVHAILLIKLGINSQEAVDEFVAEDDEDVIKMVVEALEQGIGDEAGLPRIQAQKLVIKLRKSQSS